MRVTQMSTPNTRDRSRRRKLYAVVLPFIVQCTALVVVAPALAADADGDGVEDAADWCPTTTDLNGPVPTSGQLCDGCLGDDQTVLGCNASDILACRPGPNKREYAHGLRENTQRIVRSRRGWAARCGCDPTLDGDGDGVADCVDGCPDDGDKTAPGACGCGVTDDDRDGDGAADCVDGCPDDPARTEPGDDGCGAESSTGTIATGSRLLLQTSSGSIEIPADVLPSGVVVTLSKSDLSSVEDPPANSGETPIGDAIKVEFSETPPIDFVITVGVRVPEPAPQFFRGRTRIVGGNRFAETSPAGWQLEIGRFDAATSTLYFDLRGTAQSLEFVVVGVDSGAVARQPSDGLDALADAGDSFLRGLQLPSLISTALAQGGQVQTVYADFSSFGWAILCDPSRFEEVFDGSCTAAAGQPPAVLAEKFSVAGQFLINLQFPRAAVQLARTEDIARSGLVFATSGPSQPIPAALGGGEGYFLAYLVVPEDIRPNLGFYQPATGRVTMTVEEDGIVDPQDEDTVGHELFHAAQEAEIPAVTALWIVEGSATAVGGAFVDSGSLLDYRYAGWRDWVTALNSSIDPDYYQTVEFWTNLGGGSLTYLAPFFDQLAMLGDVPLGDDYAAVNQALVNSGAGGLLPLRDAYLDLIQTRDAQMEYPHCFQGTCIVGENCTETGETGGALEAISAGCIDFIVADDVCPNGPWELTVQVDPATAADWHVLLDGNLEEPNQSIELTSSSFRVWPIFARISDGAASSPESYAIAIERLCQCGDGQIDDEEECDDGNITSGDGCDEFCLIEECGNSRVEGVEECDDGNVANGDGCDSRCTIETGVRLREQRYRVTVRSTLAYGEPYIDEQKWEAITSVEDGSAPSTRQMVRAVAYPDGSVESQNDLTEIDPVGSGSIGLALASTLEGSVGSPSEGSLAHSQAALQAAIDARSGTSLTIEGSLSSMTAVEGEAVLNQSPEARSESRYEVGFIVDRSAVLDLSWDCGLRSVAVRRVAPDPSYLVNLSRVYFSDFGWSCDPVQVPLMAGDYQITIDGSVFSERRRFDQSIGGSFRIEASE
jgi:cysteine-rich repeat protein